VRRLIGSLAVCADHGQNERRADPLQLADVGQRDRAARAEAQPLLALTQVMVRRCDNMERFWWGVPSPMAMRVAALRRRSCVVQRPRLRSRAVVALPGRSSSQRTPVPVDQFVVRHEPENTTCTCGQAMNRIGEDVPEMLDYQPGVFTVERHVRGKWVCTCCEKPASSCTPGLQDHF
jgi:hypothetical protein